jgi:plasmid stabilization system protein ParE
MPRLIWSPRALADVERLHRFLARKNKEAARRAIAAIRQSLKAIARHPEIGRPIDDMPPEFREWIVAFANGAYVALYRLDENEAVIVAVRHGREVGY